MNKLESFALSCGSKINKPHIEQSYFPLPFGKFICISQQCPKQSYEYDYMDDVIYHIKPYLDQHNINLIEIGNSERPNLFYCKNYKHLNRLQISYLINKSLLYFGNYNLYSHIASHFNKKVVSPISNEYIETIRPYWSNEKDFKLIKKETDVKPTYSSKEFPKTINHVNPEVIACEILDSLNIDHNLNSIETIYLGEEYQNLVFDLIPSPFDLRTMQAPSVINLRMDKVFDLMFLFQCVHLNKINIVTDKPIPLEYLQPLKDKIELITFFIDNKTKKEDIKQFEELGKPLNLLSKDLKNIQDIRLNFIDYKVKGYGSKSAKDLNVNVYSDLKFLSKRNIISNGQIYNSYLSLSEGQNTQSVKKKKDFWEDLPFCRVYRENS